MIELHEKAIGLRLCRMLKGDRLSMCENVVFTNGRAAVETVLLRAQLSGRVEVEGDLKDHWADVLTDSDGTWEQTVALDAKSYGALKNHWMRCKVVSVDGQVSL
jgi:hypothetical protein